MLWIDPLCNVYILHKVSKGCLRSSYLPWIPRSWIHLLLIGNSYKEWQESPIATLIINHPPHQRLFQRKMTKKSNRKCTEWISNLGLIKGGGGVPINGKNPPSNLWTLPREVMKKLGLFTDRLTFGVDAPHPPHPLYSQLSWIFFGGAKNRCFLVQNFDLSPF